METKEYLNSDPEISIVLESKEYYDLEERTFQFALRVRTFIKNLPRTISNIEDCIQLTRASGSVGANYIEANEHLSEKDLLYRIKICRKESKECKYFLRLIDTCNNSSFDLERNSLIREAQELMLIFASIIRKLETRK